MKYTQYYLQTKQRPDRIEIKPEWIDFVYKNPEKEELQNDGRIRCWAKIR
jgi:hypothetical protein